MTSIFVCVHIPNAIKVTKFRNILMKLWFLKFQNRNFFSQKWPKSTWGFGRKEKANKSSIKKWQKLAAVRRIVRLQYSWMIWYTNNSLNYKREREKNIYLFHTIKECERFYSCLCNSSLYSDSSVVALTHLIFLYNDY